MNNKNKIVIITAIVMIIIVALGIAYAFVDTQLIGTKQQIIKAGELDLILEEDENNLTLENALPMYDEVGMIQDPFTFILVNNSEKVINYQLQLIDITTGDKLNTNIVKYGLTKNGILLIKKLSELINGIIDTGRMTGKEITEYELRLWIDSDVMDNTLIEGKSLSYKVEVNLEMIDNHKIVFHPNGGIGEETSVFCIPEEECILNEINFSNQNRILTGWATSSDGEVEYDRDIKIEDTNIELGIPLNLYAVWEDENFCSSQKNTITSAINSIGGNLNTSVFYNDLSTYIREHLTAIPSSYSIQFSGKETTGSNANTTYGLPVHTISSQSSNLMSLNGTSLIAETSIPASTLSLTVRNKHLDSGMGGTTTHVIRVYVNETQIGTANMVTAHYSGYTTNTATFNIPKLATGDILSFKFTTGGRNGTSQITAATLNYITSTTGEDTKDEEIIKSCEGAKSEIITAINSVGGNVNDSYSYSGLASYIKNHFSFLTEKYKLVFSGPEATGSNKETTYTLPVNSINSQTSEFFTLNGTSLVLNQALPASSLSLTVKNRHLDTGMGGTTVQVIRVLINGQQIATSSMSTGFYGAYTTNDAIITLPALSAGSTLSFQFTTGGRNGTSQIISGSLVAVLQ